jgi:hypothetical protein
MDINNSQAISKDVIIEQMMRATALSQSLSNVTSRNYLESASRNSSNLFDISEYHKPLVPPHFFRIDQLGKLEDGKVSETFTALQTALAACHGNLDQQFVFLIIHDGISNRIYMGVRNNTKAPYAFMRTFQHFLKGLYAGSKFEQLSPEQEVYKQEISIPLERMEHSICLTGIPSVKQGLNLEHLSYIDKLLTGIQGSSFAYLVVANPLSSVEVNEVINRCRNLIGEIHSLGKINFSKSKSSSSNTQEGTQTGYSKQEGRSYDTMDNRVWKRILSEIPFGDIFLENSINTTSTNESFSKSILQGKSEAESAQIGSEFINTHVQAAEQLLKCYVDRFYNKRALGHWNVGVYCLSELPDVCQLAGMQLQAVLNGSSSMIEPVRWNNLEQFMHNPSVLNSLHRLEIPSFKLKDNFKHPLGELFSNLTTSLTTSELSLLINLPRREIPGIKLVPTAEFSLNNNIDESDDSILLGNLFDSGNKTKLRYTINHSSLCKHTFVTGITGSGKSTTCRRILTDLDKSNIPFLVIEPAKEEYVEWAFSINEKLPQDSPERIKVYIPGLNIWKKHKLTDKLKLNPLDIVWLDSKLPPPVFTHIDRVKSIFNASLPMQEALPLLLEEILLTTYSNPNDWLKDDLSLFECPRPTLIKLVDRIPSVIKKIGYSDHIAVNLIAALGIRIKNFCTGWKRELFNCDFSTPWSEIFDRPVVINLSYLGDDADKAFTMAIIFLFLYEYRQAQHSISQIHQAETLKHVTLIEEAHRLLSKISDGYFDQMTPQKKVSDMFSNIISEIRSYGEGLIIADQVPARITPDAVKNTNLKIVHRLVSADDRDSMSSCMTLTSEQSKIINHLRPGQAIICGEQDDTASWVQVLR